MKKSTQFTVFFCSTLLLLNVNIMAQTQFDAGVTAVNMDDYVTKSVQTVAGTLKNYGSATITSFDLYYSVNNGSPMAQSLSGLNVATTSSYNFTHSFPWNPASGGSYSIKVWATNINGNPDQNTANDTGFKTVQVLSNTVTKVCVWEHFTSSSCAPCAGEAPAIKSFLDANNANVTGSQVAAVKYQMNWPTPPTPAVTDPSYNSDGSTRKSYYNVSAVPEKYVDGLDADYQQQYITDALAKPAVVNIDLSYTLTADTINVTAVVTPLATISTLVKLHVAIVEKSYNYPGSATSGLGQVNFYHIMRKMLPTGSGTNLFPPLTADIPITKNLSYFLTTDNTPPPAQGSFDLWVGTSNIYVIAFVQDNTTKKVYQAAIGKLPTGINEKQFKTVVNVHPNPSVGIINLDITSASDKDNIEITVSDLIGVVVYRENLTNSGAINKNIDLSKLSNGIYALSITNSSGSRAVQKIVLNK